MYVTCSIVYQAQTEVPLTRSSAMAEGLRDALVSRNPPIEQLVPSICYAYRQTYRQKMHNIASLQ